MSRSKYAVGDRIEFRVELRNGWCAGVVADVKRNAMGQPGVSYRCETADFPEHGCSAWLQARHIRPSEIRHCRVAVVKDGNLAGCSNPVDPGWLDQHRCTEHRKQWLGLQVSP